MEISNAITKLSPGVHDQNRVNVFINDKFSFSLNLAQVVDFKLKVGKVLTDEEKAFLFSFKSDEEKYKEMFCRFWTLKESRIKHCGMGLSMAMTDFSFKFDFETNPVSVTCSEPDLFFYQDQFEEDYFFSICTQTSQDYRLVVL